MEKTIIKTEKECRRARAARGRIERGASPAALFCRYVDEKVLPAFQAARRRLLALGHGAALNDDRSTDRQRVVGISVWAANHVFVDGETPPMLQLTHVTGRPRDVEVSRRPVALQIEVHPVEEWVALEVESWLEPFIDAAMPKTRRSRSGL